MHFATETHLKEHEKVHECEKPFACRICNESFATTSELTVHAAKHEQYQCKICNMMFPSSAQCTDHVNRVHMMGLSVDDVFFSNPNSKQQRGKKWSNRTCNLCNRTFTTAASFQVHVKLHENETSFTCPVCLRQFKLEVSFDYIYVLFNNSCSIIVYLIASKSLKVRKNSLSFFTKLSLSFSLIIVSRNRLLI